MVMLTVIGALVVPAGRVTAQPVPLVFTLREEDKAKLQVTLAGTTVTVAPLVLVTVAPAPTPLAVTVLTCVPTPHDCPTNAVTLWPTANDDGNRPASDINESLTVTLVRGTVPQLLTVML